MRRMLEKWYVCKLKYYESSWAINWLDDSELLYLEVSVLEGNIYNVCLRLDVALSALSVN